MRYLWGGISLLALVIAVGMLLLITSSQDFNAQVIGGIVAIVALLAAYFANRIGRRYKAT